MPLPTILIVDVDGDRRRALAEGLEEIGFEAVPTRDPLEGVRFARALDAGFIVTSTSTAGHDFQQSGSFLKLALGTGATLLLIDENDPSRLTMVPDNVIVLLSKHLNTASLAKQLRLILVGRELGIEPDLRLECLVGDLAEHSLLELLGLLYRARLSGRLMLQTGGIDLENGEVLAAYQESIRGLKGFCRLAVSSIGPFHFFPGRTGAAREIEVGHETLVSRTIEESMGEIPPRRTGLDVTLGPALFDRPFNPLQRQIMATLTGGVDKLGDLLDKIAETDGRIVQELLELQTSGIVSFSEPEPQVAIITDSTADLPPSLARSHRIHIVPLTVLFGEQRFRDGVELSNRDFYDRLMSNPIPPSTQPPPGEDFRTLYESLPGKDVLSLHISGKMSLTIEHAREAAGRVLYGESHGQEANGQGPSSLLVLDSSLVSLSLGMLSLFAARLAERKVPIDRIAERVLDIQGRMQTLFAVDTLEYLARGGRVGRARAWVGKLLGVKPILGLKDGEVAPFDRAIGGRAVQAKLIEILKQKGDESRPIIAGIAHARAPVWADRLRRKLDDAFTIRELIVTEMGPVVGAHVGPGTVGVVFFQPNDEEISMLAPLDEN